MQKEELLPRLAAARNGDLTAQEAIILCYQQRIAGFIFSLTGETAVIEDLAQQVFLKMLRGLHQLKDSERFEAWLFRLARNVCLTHLRRERWRRRFVPFLSHHDTPAEEPPPAEESSRADWLRSAILSLPPEQRELLALSQAGDLSYEDLARLTGSSVSSVKSRLFRARKSLKAQKPHET
ncbi:MAG: RNA polymerase sigma factor [Verrucomicrobium sp.]|nr:RNA polymerase sigma factor [Verrucomicrobium sp.]